MSSENPALNPTYASYDFGKTEQILDFGIQPLWVPGGIETEVMRRDSILKDELSRLGFEIRFHPFIKGIDVNYFMKRGDLEAAAGGDMPAIVAAAEFGAFVPALADLNFTSLVARKNMLLSELRGKRIGVPYGSNAHYTLLEALSAANLHSGDIHLIPMDVDRLPQALQEGRIDAFAAWEPIPATAEMNQQGTPIYKSLSAGYIWFAPRIAERYPAVIKQVVASQIRALYWLSQSQENVLKATRWAIAAQIELTGKPPFLPLNDYATLARESLRNLSVLPLIPERDLAENGEIFQQLSFLKNLGMIPRSVSWDQIRSCFDRTVVMEVMSREREYRLYDIEFLEPEK